MPSLNLAIDRLINTGTDNFAIWVVKAPSPSCYVLRDCVWPVELTQLWKDWQQMFSRQSRIDIFSPTSTSGGANPLPIELSLPPTSQTTGSYSSRLMQHLGMSLWRWVFDGSILNSLELSRGLAMGQRTRLRLRLEIRDPDLIALPWEIMQREPGQPAMSLSQDLLFSRTISEVDALPAYLRTDQVLNILLVLGHDENLELEEEAAILQKTLVDPAPVNSNSPKYASCKVKTLLQPTPQQLIQELETKAYNVFFYAGHGLPGPDGGLLLLRPEMTLNGIELAQVLTRNSVKLAVFNACWGARPYAMNRQAIPASSLAEVLVRHGVPAVLGMRDEITDPESHSFIKTFAAALRSRKPIDEAVALARKQLLTLYRFNQPAWSLPVLYLHPEFNGELIKGLEEGITELPDTAMPDLTYPFPIASLRSLSPQGQTWFLRSGVTRIGRMPDKDNHIVIPEKSVSKNHAEILCRSNYSDATQAYYLKDSSRYGTWIFNPNGWQHILHEEVPLKSGMQLKFGSARGEIWEFLIENS